MAVNVLMPLLIPLGEQLTNVTQLAEMDVKGVGGAGSDGGSGVVLGRRQYVREVREDMEPGELLTVVAKALKKDHNVFFSIRKGVGDEAGLFSIDHTTGRISLLKDLDYEVKEKHELVVEVWAENSHHHQQKYHRHRNQQTKEEEEEEEEEGDEEDGVIRERVTVVIQVLNVNEYRPVFPRNLYKTQIAEEDDSGLPKIILTVRARDEDSGEWGRLHYTLSGDGVSNSSSTSPSSSSSSSYSHSSSSSASSSSYSPYFSSSASSSSSSSASSFSYSPYFSSSSSSSSGPSFSINPATGDVYLLKPLDRDPPHGRPQRSLRVTATDGEFIASTRVIVNLKDVNDNAPFFPIETLAVHVPEDAPAGWSVAQVVARDYDDPREGSNARLTYSLLKNVVDEDSGRHLFTVDPRTGLITTALCCLDRERSPKYTITAAATDGGGLKATGTVLVRVTDVNDTPPRFARPGWRLHVAENQPLDAVLATLPVTDRDEHTTLAFKVVPRSGRGWELFRVEAGGGEEGGGRDEGGLLKSIIPLDFENTEHRGEFRFKVQVTDKLQERQQQQEDEDVEQEKQEGNQANVWQGTHVDEAWVSVWVTDINDNPPIILPTLVNHSLPGLPGGAKFGKMCHKMTIS